MTIRHWLRSRPASIAVCCGLMLAVAPALPAGASALAGAGAAAARVPRGCPAPVVGRVTCAATVTPGVKAVSAGALAAASSAPAGLGPLQLRWAYGLEDSAFTGGVGQTVAVVTAYDDTSAESDMDIYRSEYNLPPCTTANGCFSKVNATGGTSYPPSMNGWSAPTAESLDMISAICPNCHILLVEADTPAIPTTDDPDALGQAENEAVALGAKFIDNTVLTPEATYATSEPTLDSEYFDHPGVAITAPDGSGEGYNGPYYPAASPDVIAAGGTTLTSAPTTARGWTETAYGGASGTSSGCSAYEAKPSWQTDTGCADRMLNDLSADADVNNSPVAFYDTLSGDWVTGGSDDVSAAIIAAAYALAGTSTAGTNPASYPYAHTSLINDITTGTTGTCTPAYYCTAGPGYDGPTGLGTPASAAALGPTAPAASIPGGAVTYDPDTGNQEIYTGGTPGTAFQKYENPSGTWSGYGNLSGDVENRPCAVYNPGSGNLEVYAKGSTGVVEEDAWVAASDTWSGWKSLGGSEIQGSPACVYDPLSGSLEVYETGSTGTVFEDYWRPGPAGWSGWKNLGDTLSGGPAAVYDPTTHSLQVWGTGTNGTEWQDAWTPSGGWSGWQNMGGDLNNTPSPVYDPLDGALEVYAHGPSDYVYEDWQGTDGTWSGWHTLNGSQIQGTPSAAYDPEAGSLDVFETGTTGTVFDRSWTPAGGWSAWANIGATLSGGPAAAYNPATHTMQVYGLGTNGDIYVNSEKSAGTWSGWTNLGGTPGNL
jgi:hypothetical protein